MDSSCPGAAPIDLDQIRFSPELLSCVPLRFVKTFKVLPISRDQGKLTVAVGNVHEVEALASIEEELGCVVEGVWAGQESVERKISEVYPEI
ncbi:MAG: hypothetical protein AAF492_06240 [Verrucomicrobiota bacterium]